MKKKKQPIDQPKHVIGHMKLEPRRLLNADFNLLAGSLTLDNFVDSTVSADQVTISQTGLVYSFALTDGVWSGADALGVVGDTLSTLTIDTSLAALSSILMDSNTTDQFDIDFGDLSFSGGFDITSSGATLFGDVTQQAATSFVHLGTLDIDGATNIALGEAGNDFDVVNIEGATAVALNDSSAIQLTALESSTDANVIAGDGVDMAGVIVGGNLDITAGGNVTDSGTYQVTGTTTILATGFDITLDEAGNDFVGAVSTDGVNVQLVDTNAIDLGTTTTTGNLDITAGGTITDSSALDIAGTTSVLATGFDITLDDAANDFTGTVSADGDNVTLVDSNAIDLGTTTATGNLDVTAGGNVTDSGTLTISGTTNILATGFDITLDDAANDFTGAISTNGVNVTLLDANAIDLGTTTATGNLDVTAGGNVADSGTLTITGTTNILATGFDITLDDAANDFTGVVSADGANITLVDANTINLGAITGSSLNVTSTDVVVTGVVNVGAGLASFTNTSGGTMNLGTAVIGEYSLSDAELDGITAGGFRFTSGNQAVLVNALTQTTDVEIIAGSGAVNFNTTLSSFNGLTVTSSDSIAQNIEILVAGAADLTATNDITLTQLANDFTGPISTNGVNVTLVDSNAIDLGTTTATGNLDVTAGGNVTDSGTLTITGTTNILATGFDITLDDAANDFTGAVSTNGVNVTLVDANAIDLGTTTATGNLDVTAGGNVTDSGTLTITGTTNILATGFDITLDDAANDFTGVVSADGANITLVEANTINLGAITGSSLNVTSTDVVVTGVVNVGAGLASFTNTSGGTMNLGTAVIGEYSLSDAELDGITAGGFRFTSGNQAVLVDALTQTTDVEIIAGSGAVNFNTTLSSFNGLTVTSSDSIAQNIEILVAGAADLTATNDITLTQLANDFTGPISTNGVNVTLVDSNAIDLGTTTATGNLDVTAGGNVTDSGTQTITGTTNILATGFDITLDDAANDFTGAVSTNGVNVTLVDANAIDLGTTTATGNLDVTAGGNVTDSGTQTITGNTNILATGFDITLDDAANDFTGVVSADGANITLVDANAIDLGMTTATGNLDVTAGGNVTDSGTLTITGNTNILATGFDITLDQAANDFTGAVSTNGVNVTLVDLNAIDLGTTTATGNLDVTAGGNVTDSGTQTIAGTTNIDATGFDITLDQATNDFTGAVSINAVNVILVDANAIDLGASTITGNLDATATTGNITDSGIASVSGLAQFTATAGSIDLDLLDVSGMIGLNSFDSATIVNATSVDLAASSVGTDLVVTATTGDITDSGVIDVNGMAQFNAPAGSIVLDLLDVTGSIGLASFASATIVNTTSVDLRTSVVGGNLMVTATTGNITQSGVLTVGGTSDFVSGTGDVCLTDIGNDFIGEVSATAATVEFVDRNDLVAGIILADDDIFLRSGATVAGSLTLNGNLTTTAVDGQILLQADSGVTQAITSIITTQQLLLGGNDIDEGSGSFVLNQANVVEAMVADLQGNLELANSSSLIVADLNYLSNCGTTEAICGLNVGGNLNLNITGDLLQAAAVIIQGTTDLTATGIICWTGGDCTGDLLNDNDFVGEVTATANTVEIVDSNALIVGVVSAVDDIFLRSGDNGSGSLTLNGTLTTIAANGQILLQSDSGVTQAITSIITTSELLLGGDLADERSGNFTLGQANSVDFLAADLQDNLTFVNSNSLQISDLTYDSECSSTEAICGLNIGGTLVLDITGSLTQTAAVIVQGTSNLAASVNLCLNGGDCTGDFLNDNDFVGEVTATGTTVEIVDSNALVVGVVSAVDDIFLRSGDNGSGNLTLNGNLTTTAVNGQVLLQSDSGVTQAITSVITTGELLLGGDLADEGSGNFILDQANVVSMLAATLQDNLTFVDSNSLVISDLTYNSDCDTTEAICGLNIGGDLVLDITGSLTQTAAVIVQGTSNLTATINVCLTGGDCTGDLLNDNDFVGEVTATGTTVEIVDSNALVVGVVSAVDDIFLRAGDNGSGSLTLNGNLTTTAVNGQILLQSDSGVTQAITSIITTQQLLLGGNDIDEGSGSFVLNQANVVEAMVADLQGNLELANSSSLIVADLNYLSNCGTTEAICGLNVGGNLNLNITGNLRQAAAVIVQGTTDLTATGIICWTGGDCTGDLLNDNDFVGEVTATANTVEIVDSNALIVGNINAVNHIFLRSGENGVGSLTLNGNLTTSSAFGQTLLQSDSGITQAATSVITTRQLLLGGELADEGSGGFNLTGVNQVSFVGANLPMGTLQLNNDIDLTIAVTLTYTSCTPAFNQSVSGVFVGGDGANLLFADPNIALANTVQGTNGNIGQRFNPLFTQFFDTTDTGIAIQNAGALTTVVGADVVATQADILLQTTSGGVLSVNDSVTVINPANRILAIAGGDLAIGAGGRFERGLLGSDGLVRTELNDLILQNPGILSTTFAQVDTTTLNQRLQFVYGTFGEQLFESTIFWGIVGAEDNSFDLDSLNAGQLAALEALLFGGGTNFESRSFYGVDPFSTFDGFADGVSDIVLSQPIGNPFDNSGTVNDSPAATASFRLDFLRNNPEFRNVQFLFNDANINLFENSSTNLVDLNVATADFSGLARIGESPVLIIERTEFQVPQRVETTITPEVEFFQSVVVEESPLFVQTVSERFVIIVYFDSQFEADNFESEFDELSLELGDQETGAMDFELVQKKLLNKLEADVLKWDSTDEDTALDVNQIRQVLEQAGLDLDDDETSQWIKDYQEWIVQREQDDTLRPPKIPRGVFKIIEVDNGKAVIQGDDVDRRIVPEPDNSGDSEDYRFEEEGDSESPPEKNATSLQMDDPVTHRVARWAAMLDPDSGGLSEPALADPTHAQPESSGRAWSLGAGSTTVGLLAMLCHRNGKNNKTINDEIQSLGELKAERPDRNIFSRAARFTRRNAHLNRTHE